MSSQLPMAQLSLAQAADCIKELTRTSLWADEMIGIIERFMSNPLFYKDVMANFYLRKESLIRQLRADGQRLIGEANTELTNYNLTETRLQVRYRNEQSADILEQLNDLLDKKQLVATKFATGRGYLEKAKEFEEANKQ